MASDEIPAEEEPILKNRVQTMIVFNAQCVQIAGGLGVFLTEDSGTFWPHGGHFYSDDAPAFLKLANAIPVPIKSIHQSGFDWVFTI